MNITSLLQEAPSRDRTRRKPWEDAVNTSKSVGEPWALGETTGTGHYSSAPPESMKNYNVGQDYSRPASSAGSYYQKQIGKEAERGGQPIETMRDYSMQEPTRPLSRIELENAEREWPTNATSGRTGHSSGRRMMAEDLSYSEPLDFHGKQSQAPESVKPSLVNANTLESLPPPPRTPSPVLDPVDLGTFIYPNLPFPIRRSLVPFNRRNTLKILVPAAHIPTNNVSKDSRARRIWGGIPHFDQRKIFTDDSDVLFAALHSGIIKLDPESSLPRQDLQLVLRLYPASDSGRYAGGLGEHGLTSASWGNSHEGCAFTILSATWVPNRAARSYSRQNRKARMAEDARRRAEIMSGLAPLVTLALSSTIHPSLMTLGSTLETHPLEDELASLSVTGLWQNQAGFKYDPMTFYLMNFSPHSSVLPEKVPMRPGTPYTVPNRAVPKRIRSDVILESSAKFTERLVLVPQQASSTSSSDDQSQSTEVSHRPVFDLYRETKPDKAQLPDAHGTDGVTQLQPATALINGMSHDAPWLRTLLHTSMNVDHISFTQEGIVVQEHLYPVMRWRFSSKETGSRTKPGTKAGVVQPKRKPKKSKKSKGSKLKKDVAQNGSTPTTGPPTSVPSPDIASATAAEAAATTITTSEETLTDTVGKGAPAKDADVQMAGPPPVEDEKEEGELSG